MIVSLINQFFKEKVGLVGELVYASLLPFVINNSTPHQIEFVILTTFDM